MIKTLQKSQVKIFLDEVKRKDENGDTYKIIFFIYHTGNRIGTSINLKCYNFDFRSIQ